MTNGSEKLLAKNGDVYGISPLMKTGSSGFASPGWTGSSGSEVGTGVCVGWRVGVAGTNPLIVWQAKMLITSEAAKKKRRRRGFIRALLRTM
jgi:hypothetical protein